MFSINLDLTTACNFRCPGCIDKHILNKGVMFKKEELFSSLEQMYKDGLKSVILLGGGEPTIAPEFEDCVKFLKERNIQVAVVTNGTMMHKIANVAHLFTARDWIRLSIDAGTDKTFQAMHNPVKSITLNQICENVLAIRKNHPKLQLGFSFVVTAGNKEIPSNHKEIILAAELAKKYGFSYISFKPYLERSSKGDEILVIGDEEITKLTIQYLDEAKKLQTPDFKVVENNRFNVLRGKSDGIDYTKHPNYCHMTYFRKILSPLGLFTCPALRGNKKVYLNLNNAYASKENTEQTKQITAKHVINFNPSKECSENTCQYAPVNWFVEDLIQHPEKLNSLNIPKEDADFFL
jgi:wyosine [tRNA(Phe)-imidazoG37] synthetase (radical SAM superfamily)